MIDNSQYGLHVQIVNNTTDNNAVHTQTVLHGISWKIKGHKLGVHLLHTLTYAKHSTQYILRSHLPLAACTKSLDPHCIHIM